MNITVFAVCRNEEKILPYFLKHYSTFCKKIVIYDNESTDDSVNIVKNWKKCKTEVVTFKTNNEFCESILTNIRNRVHRRSETDLVIVVDCDEFLYHPNIKQFLTKNYFSYYCTIGYDMVCEKFPENYEFPLTHQVKTGVRNDNYSKSVLFNKSIIANMNFSYGSHHCNPIALIGKNIIPYTGGELKLLHYKQLGYDYLMDKHIFRESVMSELSRLNGWGTEISEDIKLRFQKNLNECSQIIP